MCGRQPRSIPGLTKTESLITPLQITGKSCSHGSVVKATDLQPATLGSTLAATHIGGGRKGIWPVETWVLAGSLVVIIWSFACHIAPTVTTISTILSSKNIQKGDILVPANQGPQGKIA